MSERRYRWIQEAPSPLMVGKQDRSPRMADYPVRLRAKHPLARWRAAVAGVFEPLILAIIPLLLWGMIGSAAVPMTLGIGLAGGLVLLVGLPLLISACVADAGGWQPGEGR